NKRSRRVDRLVERFFSAVECRELLLLPGPQRLPRFYQLWTLKEAFIKAMGMGLALPLDSFSFSFSDTGPIVFSVHDSARIDAADGCLFLQVDCGEDYACAIAINGMTGNSAPGIFGWRMTALNEFCDAPVPVLAAIQG
ncbi:MAG: 4'-phosphopantetheinyl transferase superfamily protein, partial [Gammaproteobacteria bacterium]